MDFLNYVWPGLAVWLAWVWVAIGQWMLAKKAMEVMGKTPSLASFYLTITILGIALVESAVIYGLVVAFQLLWTDTIGLYSSIWAWLAIWLAWFGAWVWEGFVISWALWAIDRSPEIKWKIMSFMVLFVALVEVIAIYGLIVAFKIIGGEGSPVDIWAWLAVWLAWVWVAIGQWMLAQRAMDVISKTPAMTTFFLTVTILGIALVESAVIYGLVVSFQLLATQGLGLYSSIAAWLAIWLTWLWAGWWEGQLIAGSLTAMNRNPEIKWKLMTFMVLFVALVEVTAIYGLIIAFRVIGSWVESFVYLWAWLAIGLAWVWVAIGRWYMSEKSLEVMGQNPKMISFFLTVSILWVALIESAAIYGLIVAFQILSIENLSPLASLWAWLAIWFTGWWAWVWEGLLIKWAIDSINRSPETKGKSMAFMVLFVALIEVVAIYWLIISFKVLGATESPETVKEDKVIEETITVEDNKGEETLEVIESVQ